MKKKSFEEQLSHKTSEFSLTPRAGLWGDIEQHLVPEKRKRRAIVFWLWLGATVVITSVTMYTFNTSETLSSPRIANYNTKINGDVMPANDVPTINAPISKRQAEIPPPSALNPNHQLLKQHQPTAQNNPPAALQSAANTKPDNRTTTNTGNFISEQKKPEEAIPVSPIAEEIIQVINTADSSTIAEVKKAPKVDTPKTLHKIIIARHYYTGFAFAPMISGSSLSLGEASSQARSNDPQYDLQYRQTTDKGIFGFSIGWVGGFEKNRHHVHTGLQYSKMGYQLLVKNIERKDVVNSSVPFVYQNVATDSFALTEKNDGAAYVTNKFHYLYIPLGYSYLFMNKPTYNIGICGEFAYNYLLNSKALLYDAGSGYYIKQNSQNQTQLSRSNIMLGGGLELNFNVSKNSKLCFKPLYRYTLKPVEKAAINTRMHSLEMGISWRWYFR